MWSFVPREGRFPDAAEYQRRCAKPFPLVAVYLDSFSDFALMDRAGNHNGFVGTEWKVQIQDHLIEVGERYAYSVGVHIRCGDAADLDRYDFATQSWEFLPRERGSVSPNPAGKEYLSVHGGLNLVGASVFVTADGVPIELPIAVEDSRFLSDCLVAIGFDPNKQELHSFADVVGPLRLDRYTLNGELIASTDLGLIGEPLGSDIDDDGTATLLIREYVRETDPRARGLDTYDTGRIAKNTGDTGPPTRVVRPFVYRPETSVWLVRAAPGGSVNRVPWPSGLSGGVASSGTGLVFAISQRGEQSENGDASQALDANGHAGEAYDANGHAGEAYDANGDASQTYVVHVFDDALNEIRAWNVPPMEPSVPADDLSELRMFSPKIDAIGQDNVLLTLRYGGGGRAVTEMLVFDSSGTSLARLSDLPGSIEPGGFSRLAEGRDLGNGLVVVSIYRDGVCLYDLDALRER